LSQLGSPEKVESIFSGSDKELLRGKGPQKNTTLCASHLFCRLSAKVCRLVSGLIGLRWTVKGMEHLSRERNTACVMVANHQSSLDILGMFEIWHVMGKVTVVAKRELMFAGTFGIAAWLCNLIFIDRTNPTSAKDVINKAMETMVPQNVS